MATKAAKKTTTKAKIVAAPEVAKDVVFNMFVGDARGIFDALMCCISTEETRYYPNGVCLDSSKEGLIAVSTDGHRLARLDVPVVVNEVDAKGKDVWKASEKITLPAFSHIVPRAFIKRLGTLADHPFLREVCTITIKDGWVHYKDKDEGFSAKLIDGTFPDWRKVYPKDTAEGDYNVAFNSKYLSQLSASIRKVHGRHAPVAIKIKSKTDPVVLHSNIKEKKLAYVLMPTRF